MLTAEQLQERRTGIGGSEMAAVLGLSKWNTALGVYQQKIGAVTNDLNEDDNERLYWGNILEAPIAKAYEKRTGYKVQRRNKTMRHKDADFMLSHLDRWVVGQRRGLEIKNVDLSRWREWGEDGTDQVPQDYLIQVHHYLLVWDLPVFDVAALFGGNTLRIFTVERSADMDALLLEAGTHFWQEHVLKQVPPPADYSHRSTNALFKKLYPGTNGEVIQLPERFQELQAQRVELQTQMRADKKAVDAINNEVLDLMGNSAVGLLPDGTAFTRAERNRKGYTVEPTTYMQLSHTSKPRL